MHKFSEKQIKVALVGNPNCGKTTLFNQLTGSNQYVGNWPGVTVEKKSGKIKVREFELEIVDLPGIYSLSPYSQEELVSRTFILDEKPDIILNIVDASNIERNLYLTTQLMELDCKVVVAVNMIDLLKKHGDFLDNKLLKKELNVPVACISASKGKGIDEMLNILVHEYEHGGNRNKKKIYCDKVEVLIKKIEDVIKQATGENFFNKRFFAVKIFEGDLISLSRFNFSKEQKDRISEIITQFKDDNSMDIEMIIAEQRYKFISSVCKIAMRKKENMYDLSISDKIDVFVTNKFLAIPIFALILLSIFFITFGPFGIMLRDGAQDLITNKLGSHVASWLTDHGASEWAISLVVNGVIVGLGSVVSFLPQIIILFTLLSILEDSGYMARGSFIMDHMLRKIGLSGKAFVPLLMGFGCTVPAVLGTRTLENNRDRRLAIMMTPFMSCSAKMPVYAVFVSTFFKRNQPVVILSLYFLGLLAGIVSTKLIGKTVLKGETPSFLMEMPDYHWPTFKNLFLHVWDKVKDFLLKAGTVLLGATIVIWFLQSFDFSLNLVEDSSKSIIARIGTIISPVFSVCGFDDWRASVSLLTGIIAKESIVSTLAILNGGNAILATSLTSMFTPLSAYAFLVFVLLYTPCIAALSTISKELKSFKWTLFVICYQIIIAFALSAIVFQMGKIFESINNIIILFAGISVVVFLVTFINSYKKGKCVSCSGKCSGCKKFKRK